MPPTSSCRVLRTLRYISKVSDGRARLRFLQHVGISDPRTPTALQCGKPQERSSIREIPELESLPAQHDLLICSCFALSADEGVRVPRQEPPRQPRRLPPLLLKEGSFCSAITHSRFTIYIFSKTKRPSRPSCHHSEPPRPFEAQTARNVSNRTKRTGELRT